MRREAVVMEYFFPIVIAPCDFQELDTVLRSSVAALDAECDTEVSATHDDISYSFSDLGEFLVAASLPARLNELTYRFSARLANGEGRYVAIEISGPSPHFYVSSPDTTWVRGTARTVSLFVRDHRTWYWPIATIWGLVLAVAILASSTAILAQRVVGRSPSSSALVIMFAILIPTSALTGALAVKYLRRSIVVMREEPRWLATHAQSIIAIGTVIAALASLIAALLSSFKSAV